MPLPNILEFIGTNITQRKFQEAQEKLLNYLGIEVPTKTELNSEILKLNNAITPKADKIYVDSALSSFQNGALKTYPTLAAANADIANITLNTKVEVLSATEGGSYYKATAGATTLTKSPYDSLTQAKADATTKANAAEVNAKKAISDYTIQKTQSTKNKFEGEDSFKYGQPWAGYTSTNYYLEIPVSEGQRVVISNNVALTLSVRGYVEANNTKLNDPLFTQIAADKNGGIYAYAFSAAPANAAKVVLVWSTEAGKTFDRSMFQIEIIPVGGIAKPTAYVSFKRFADYLTKNEFAANKSNIGSMPESTINPNNHYEPYNTVGTYLSADAHLSNLIPTVEGDKWYMQRPPTAASAWFYFYDSNKVRINQVLYPYATAPANAAYVVGVLSNTTTDDAATQAYNTSPAAPVQIEKGLYPTPIFPRYQLPQVAYKNDILEFNNLKGKHLYAFGDSITYAGAWLGACNMLGMTFKNFAISGGEWTVNNHIATQIDNAEAWINAGNRLPDIIGIALGTNDWGNSRPIGDLQATMAMAETAPEVVNHATVLAAIKYAIIRLRALTPNAFIFLIAPLQRHNLYNYDYIQAVIDGGKMMSVPVMRAYDESGLNAFDPTNKTKWFTDGLHTTTAGNKKYSGYVAKKLCQIYAVDQV